MRRGKIIRSRFPSGALVAMPPPSGPDLDAATTAWVDAVVAATGAVSDLQKSRVDALIVGLKSDGLFSANSRLWIHAGESDQYQATIDIMGLATATNHGATLGATGYAGDGASYIDLGAIPSNYTRDDASLGSYNLYDSTSEGFWVLIGAHDTVTPNNSAIMPGGGSSTGYIACQGANAWLTFTFTNRKGMYIVSSKAVTEYKAYKNSSVIATDSPSPNEITGLGNFYALAWNEDGTAGRFSPSDIVGSSWIGPYLNSTDVTNLTNRINAYMTAWGINVFVS